LTVTAVTRLEPIFEPVIEMAGFKLVRLRMMGGAQQTLQVMAERPDGTMDVEGCTILSHALLDFIEANDPVPGEYEIEVSSPGIDRPLTRPMDFIRWAGHEAKIELTEMVPSVGESQSDQNASVGESQSDQNKGRKRFRAVVLGMEDGDVVIRPVDNRADGNDVRFPFRSLANAKLVLTDKLIAEDLKARRSVGESRSDQTNASKTGED
jgi:ribosome maturation factor RimP